MIGGLTGGLASIAGVAISSSIRQVDSGIGKILAHTAGGIIISSCAGALGMLLQNVVYYKKI